MTRRTLARVLAAGAVSTALMMAGPLAAAGEDDLEQTLAPDEATGTGQVELGHGHVDLGPRFVDGQWRLQAHDDSAEPPVWRSLDDVVLRVGDAALLTVPDDPAYAFLGLPAGAQVHVVPQTQDPDVVWVGWNTQDPAVMAAIDRGVTLGVTQVEGPGELVVYLQSGNLGEPQVLWDSTKAMPQDVWVDVDTHTHANWVFSAPGVYLVGVRVAAELASGESVASDATLRFAVGDAADAGEALAGGIPAAAGPSPAATELGALAPDAADPTGLVLTIVVVALIVALVAALLIVLVGGARARRRAERDAS
ncbi:choice-of-anchor M domain-containing protein [Compostimonas suwonensis]|uniref:Surface-anchored protein n=1 Tax=Compostimonas suwonensis TaxID=1048394 RepID=A0A2M9BCM7_9MICO|nr:choice-of-anchor M domain-containing protein [Compostimonas suwonensis]PJJ55682.1 surface-anchored protein [Compostimonas suwonensis]